MVIWSAYMPFDSHEPPLSEEWRNFVNCYCVNECDSNARHSTWGNKDTYHRIGFSLDFLISTKLTLLIQGQIPIFTKSTWREVIGLFLLYLSISDVFKRWHVLSDMSLLEHRQIYFLWTAKRTKIQRNRNRTESSISNK